MTPGLLDMIARHGGALGRRLRRGAPDPHEPAAPGRSAAPSRHSECAPGFELLVAAMHRQLQWADDYRRFGDLRSAITAMVDASAIVSELRRDDLASPP